MGIQKSVEVSTVSVVIPTYNYAHFLIAAVESCVSQSYKDMEVIVIDDGSTDNTSEVVGQFPTVRYHYQKNSGLSGARNKGISVSSSKYIVFLDADDVLLPHAVESLVNNIGRHPSAAFVVGRHHYMSGDGSVQKRVAAKPRHQCVYQALLEHNFIACPGSVIYRRKALQESGGFDVTLNSCEDYDVYLRLARAFDVAVFDDPVVLYRVHENSMSKNGKVMMSTVLEVMGRQKAHIENSDKLNVAFHAGLRRWKSYYGTSITSDLIKMLSTGQYSRFLEESLYMLKLSPILFAKCIVKCVFGKREQHCI